MPFAAGTGSAEASARMGRAWRELRRGAATAVLIERLFGVPGEPDSVEPGQLDVLDLLTSRNDWRMSDLAAVLRVDPSTVTRTLQRMEAARLAERIPASGDGRVVKVRLTEEGRRLHGVVAGRRTEILNGIFGSFTAADRDRLVELLDRFVESLEKYVADSTGGDRAATPR